MSNLPATYPLIHQQKPLYSPARNALAVPTSALRDAILAEWEALGANKPQASLLPLTGFAALTQDVILPQRAEIVNELLEYGETDLLFYRDAEDLALAAQQAKAWQPWVQWAESTFGTQYVIAGGLMPVEQPASNHARHRQAVEALSPWQLACLAAVVKPTTSLLLGLAFMARQIDAATLFTLSRLEEAHNIVRWGEDAEAAERAATLMRDLSHAERWHDLLLTAA